MDQGGAGEGDTAPQIGVRQKTDTRGVWMSECALVIRNMCDQHFEHYGRVILLVRYLNL